MVSVGLDIRPLIFTRAGIKTYLYNLILGLARTGGCKLHLFISSKSRIDWSNMSADIYEELVRLPHISDAWGRFWENCLLPGAVKRRGCDVFHGARFFVPGGLSCPSVVSVHDVAFKRFPQFLTAKALRYFDAAVASSVRSAVKVIVPSEATGTDLREFYGVPQDKISVVYEAAGQVFSAAGDGVRLGEVKRKLAVKGRYILSVGTIEPRKNYPNLLKAFAGLKNARELQLVIVGGLGWLYRDVLDTALRLGLKDRVILAGHMGDEDLAELYRGCEFFVFPSLYEGFGLPVLEAMQCGACVVASNTSSVKELFGGCVLPVRPESVGSIAEAMDQALADQALRGRLSAAGMKRAADFSWEKTAQETLAVYNAAINPKP
ncbi:MAG: glycosyltransferase family 1 protein [Candidatus Omnitrophota bacterium]